MAVAGVCSPSLGPLSHHAEHSVVPVSLKVLPDGYPDAPAPPAAATMDLHRVDVRPLAIAALDAWAAARRDAEAVAPFPAQNLPDEVAEKLVGPAPAVPEPDASLNLSVLLLREAPVLCTPAVGPSAARSSAAALSAAVQSELQAWAQPSLQFARGSRWNSQRAQ